MLHFTIQLYKIFYDIIPRYTDADTNFQTFDVDITKLSDTTDIKVIFTFDWFYSFDKYLWYSINYLCQALSLFLLIYL